MEELKDQYFYLFYCWQFINCQKDF